MKQFLRKIFGSLLALPLFFSCASANNYFGGYYVSPYVEDNDYMSQYEGAMQILTIDEEEYVDANGIDTLMTPNENRYSLSLTITSRLTKEEADGHFYGLTYNNLLNGYSGSFSCSLLYGEDTHAVTLYVGFDGSEKGILLRDEFQGDYLFCFLPPSALSTFSIE